ncbi:MAG: methionyl-tRNA formyltransferase [Verrucomicrobiota bacterium]
MRILFIGTGDIGVPSLEMLAKSGEHSLVGVVTQPDKPVGRHQEIVATPVKKLALQYGIPVFQPEKIRAESALSEIQNLKPDLIVVMAYGQILPQAVLDAPSVACLNLHASLLPRHRGASPIQAAIEAGDLESGITVMHVSAGLDEGDVLLSKKIPILRRETGGSLHDRLAALSPVALVEALSIISQGNLPRVPQDPAQVTYAAKLTRENGHIDWSADAIVIDRKIRAMNPWPASYTTLPGGNLQPRKLKVFSAILCRKSSGPVGEVLRADKHGLLVGCGSGALLLRSIQLEGKRRMSLREFLPGHPVAPGTVLGGA